MSSLTALYEWFNNNREEIIAGHKDECVLLKDNAVIGYYPNKEAALSAARKRGFSVGGFLIQNCKTEEEDGMRYYNRAVCFG
jgi:hypothetical protein